MEHSLGTANVHQFPTCSLKQSYYKAAFRVDLICVIFFIDFNFLLEVIDVIIDTDL